MGLARVRETTFSQNLARHSLYPTPPRSRVVQGLPTSGVRLSRPVMTLVLCFLPCFLARLALPYCDWHRGAPPTSLFPQLPVPSVSCPLCFSLCPGMRRGMGVGVSVCACVEETLGIGAETQAGEASGYIKSPLGYSGPLSLCSSVESCRPWSPIIVPVPLWRSLTAWRCW